MATKKTAPKSSAVKKPAAVLEPRLAKRKPVRPPASPAAVTRETRSMQPAVPDKPRKKLKLVRDSFTMPKDDYLRLAELKARSAAAGHTVKKSEVLRAGLAVLWSLNDVALAAAIAAVPRLATGRPQGSKTIIKASRAIGTSG